ncbi:MAG: hypothetical protein IPJ34_42440 [Myxococcales bacterium]|nr:hypothetical protein [Myxococcales bacterium]
MQQRLEAGGLAHEVRRPSATDHGSVTRSVRSVIGSGTRERPLARFEHEVRLERLGDGGRRVEPHEDARARPLARAEHGDRGRRVVVVRRGDERERGGLEHEAVRGLRHGAGLGQGRGVAGAPERRAAPGRRGDRDEHPHRAAHA